MIINATGAVTTAVVALVVASTKFLEGAWVVVLLIPLLVLLLLGIQRHYLRFERECTFDLPVHPEEVHHRLIVPIDKLNRPAVQSLAYARSISQHVTAVHVILDMDKADTLQQDWQRWQQQLGDDEETHLLIIDSPYRSLIRPLLAYIDTIHERYPQDTLSVVLPEFVVAHWWQHFLHNQTALRLKASLLFRPGIVVINLPQHLESR
jgi:hypothetical protein